MHACIQRVWPVPTEAKKSVGCLGTGVADGCELPCGCWALNLGPFQEYIVLLTVGPCLYFLLFYSARMEENTDSVF